MLTRNAWAIGFLSLLILAEILTIEIWVLQVTNGKTLIRIHELEIFGFVLFLYLLIILSYSSLKNSSFRDVKIKRTVDLVKVFNGDYNYIELTVENNTPHKFTNVEVIDYFPETFDLVKGNNVCKFTLKPMQKFSFAYILKANTRGEYDIGPIKVHVSDDYGYSIDTLIFQERTKITILPTVPELSSYGKIAERIYKGKIYGIHSTKEKGIGMDFAGLRKYIPGDDYKWIDWKSTARTMQLITRNFEIEKNANIIIFLDCSESMGHGIFGRTKLDLCIEAVLLLGSFAMKRKDKVGLLLYRDNIELFLKPSIGNEHYYHILNILAPLRSYGGANLRNAILHAISSIHEKSVFIILSDMESDTLSFYDGLKLAKSRKHEIVIISPFTPLFEITEEEKQLVKSNALLRVMSDIAFEDLFEEKLSIKREVQKWSGRFILANPSNLLKEISKQYFEAKRMIGGIT